MPATFGDTGAGAYFPNSGIGYPSQGLFESALEAYRQMLGPGSTKTGQLAEAGASNAPGQQYQASAGVGAPAGGPSAGFGAGAFAQLLAGLRGAQGAGRTAKTGAQAGAIQGAEGVGSDEANSESGAMAGQIKLDKANVGNAFQNFGLLSSLLNGITAPNGFVGNAISGAGGGTSGVGGLLGSLFSGANSSLGPLSALGSGYGLDALGLLPFAGA